MFELNPIRPSSNPQQASRDGSEIELQSDGSYIQWRYKGFRKWFNLISLKELKGSPGTQGKPGKDGSKGSPGSRGSDGTDGPFGPRGLAGKEGEQGERGLPGIEGPEGRKIDLRKSDTHIQWKHTGDSLWIDLFPLDQLKGPQGVRGKDGPEGPQGDDGPRGIKGEDGDRGGGGPQGSPGPTGPIGPQGPPGSGGGALTTGVPNELPNGTRTVFTVPDAYVNGSLQVFLNGLKESFITQSSSTTLTFNPAPISTDIIELLYRVQ